jgi:dTDP-4-amino-4,6-dideoxygalactose transaminase
LPGIPIIEDCAHAFLSTIGNQPAGSLGDAAVFSIGKAKFPSIGPGGIVVINNPDYLPAFETQHHNLTKSSVLQELVNIARNILLAIAHRPFVYRMVAGLRSDKVSHKVHEHQSIRIKEARMAMGSLGILTGNRHRFNAFLAKQQEHLNLIAREAFPDRLPDYLVDPVFRSNGFLLPALVDQPDTMIRHFRRKGIELGRHFSRSIGWAKDFGYQEGQCPMAEKIAKTLVSIPCHYALTSRQINKIINAFREINHAHTVSAGPSGSFSSI